MKSSSCVNFPHSTDAFVFWLFTTHTAKPHNHVENTSRKYNSKFSRKYCVFLFPPVCKRKKRIISRALSCATARDPSWFHEGWVWAQAKIKSAAGVDARWQRLFDEHGDEFTGLFACAMALHG